MSTRNLFLLRPLIEEVGLSSSPSALLIHACSPCLLCKSTELTLTLFRIEVHTYLPTSSFPSATAITSPPVRMPHNIGRVRPETRGEMKVAIRFWEVSNPYPSTVPAFSTWPGPLFSRWLIYIPTCVFILLKRDAPYALCSQPVKIVNCRSYTCRVLCATGRVQIGCCIKSSPTSREDLLGGRSDSQTTVGFGR
jgi:hypothetical protein